VAILASGRLIASGKISEIHAFQIRGWELVVANLEAALLERHRSRVTKSTAISDKQYALELPLEPGPDQLLRDLIAGGARLISLNPMRETLEDFFVEQVSKQEPR
jgi:hypothetical protein